MKKYLYLLPFRDKPFFKIGISSNNESRIGLHHKNFNINLEESYIIESTNSRIITLLERELLCCFPISKWDNTLKIDGYTEIRDLEYLEETINIIKNKHINFGIKISKYYDRIKKEITVNSEQIDINTKIKTTSKIKNIPNFNDSIMPFKKRIAELKKHIILVERGLGAKYSLEWDKGNSICKEITDDGYFHYIVYAKDFIDIKNDWKNWKCTFNDGYFFGFGLGEAILVEDTMKLNLSFRKFSKNDDYSNFINEIKEVFEPHLKQKNNVFFIDKIKNIFN